MYACLIHVWYLSGSHCREIKQTHLRIMNILVAEKIIRQLRAWESYLGKVSRKMEKEKRKLARLQSVMTRKGGNGFVNYCETAEAVEGMVW